MKTKPGAKVTSVQQSTGSSNHRKEFPDHNGQLMASRPSTGSQVPQSTTSGILKNDTNDGDRGSKWACGTCTFVNDAVTDKCAMCYLTRSSTVMKTKPGSEVTYVQQSTGSCNYRKEFPDHNGQLMTSGPSTDSQVPQSAKSGNLTDGTRDGTRDGTSDGDRGLSWTCGACTFLNDAVADNCAMCYEAKKMKIAVTASGRYIEFKLNPTAKIGALKALVKDWTGIPHHQQFFWFGPQLLEDERLALNRYGVQEGSHLQLVTSTDLQVYVHNISGEKQTVTVGKHQTVKQLKQIIEVSMGIPADAQRLINEDEPLNNNKQTLEQCRVQNQSIITLINVNVRPSGNSDITIFIKDVSEDMTIRIPSNNTVEALKMLIEEKRKDYSIDAIRLIYAGKSLQDHLKLSDYQIKHESTISLIPRLRGS